jgi:hypothetical protein
MGWIGLAKDRERRRALVKTVVKCRVHKMLRSSGVAAQMAAPPRRPQLRGVSSVS